MKKKIKRIGVIQTGMVMAIIYGVLSLFFVPFMIFGAFIETSKVGFGILMLLVFPLLYTAGGFVTGIVSAALYNLAAKWAGGIELEFTN